MKKADESLDDSSGKKEDKAQEKDQSSPMEDSPEVMATRFKETFSRPDVRVHFIGVWCVPTIIAVCLGL